MKNVAILIFDDVEELDAVGPYEVFGIAAEFRENVCNVYLVSESGDAVSCSHNMRLLPHYSFETAPRPDILIIPGGKGSRVQKDNDGLLRWCVNMANSADYIASICTGLRITLAAGLSCGKRVTTHWAAIDELRDQYEETDIVSDLRFVRDGNYISSAGISAGIDMSLWLVGQIADPALAREVLREMEYNPAPPYLSDA